METAANPVAVYEAAARELISIENEISARTRHGAVEGFVSDIVTRLINKRDALSARLVDLKIAADSAPQVESLRVVTHHIHFPRPREVPIGTLVIDDVIGPMPEFLRRVG